MGVCSMNRLLVKLAITAAAGSLLCSDPIGAQNPPPGSKTAHVEITKGPGLEVGAKSASAVSWVARGRPRVAGLRPPHAVLPAAYQVCCARGSLR